jgi:two-component system cell cycle sensor histidine kinase/response regulator CckA
LTDPLLPTNPAILLVDDEPTVLRSASAALASAGYTIEVAENGSDALRVFRESPDRFALIVADVMMPVMGGVELATQVLATHPDMKILFLSGYADVTVEATARPLPLLRKPFLPDHLRSAVRDLLKQK